MNICGKSKLSTASHAALSCCIKLSEDDSPSRNRLVQAS